MSNETSPNLIVLAITTETDRKGWSPIPAPFYWGRDEALDGLRAEWHFDNGFGASVISNRWTGVELAVLEEAGGTWPITYDTPITCDVLKIGDEAELRELLRDIMAL